MEIIWHKKATQDLNQNINHIAKISQQNAIMVLDEIMNLVESLIIFPYKYPKEPIYNNENIRFVTKWSFKIIYRIDSNKLYILRIFNTNKNPLDLIE